MSAAGHLLWILFGPGTWGSGGNMVAWVICGVIGGLLLRAKLKAHHLAELAQAARHHKASMAQSAAQHQQLMVQARAHHDKLMAHVTATAAEPQVSAGSTPFDSRERLDGAAAGKLRRPGASS
jgi:hypothetical protein